MNHLLYTPQGDDELLIPQGCEPAPLTAGFVVTVVVCAAVALGIGMAVTTAWTAYNATLINTEGK